MDQVEPPKSSHEAKWKRFEKLVYEIQKSFSGTTAIVTHKDYIVGADSKVEREIDISIKQQVAQFPIIVVIDCKDYAEPVDVKSVEEFAGLAEDAEASSRRDDPVSCVPQLSCCSRLGVGKAANRGYFFRSPCRSVDSCLDETPQLPRLKIGLK
jgi:hypothetical protein